MTPGGRRPTISDREILEALSGDDLIYSTGEIAEQSPINNRSMYHRLVPLRERGLVDSKKIGAGLAWWLTEEGRETLDSDEDI